MIHLKHKEHHIVSFIAGSQRMTLIRLLPLVSAVIENHLQFTPNVETAREQVTVVCLIQSFLQMGCRKSGLMESELLSKKLQKLLIIRLYLKNASRLGNVCTHLHMLCIQCGSIVETQTQREGETIFCPNLIPDQV